MQSNEMEAKAALLVQTVLDERDTASPPRLETPRLVLDGHLREDIEPLAALWADPDVVRHISGKPSTRQESWARLLRYRGLWPILGYGFWAVRERQTGRFIGDVGFADFKRDAQPSMSGVPEVGWVLSTWAHGRGYASEAVAAALTWLDCSEQINEVICLIETENLASLRIAKKMGFSPAGDVDLGGEKVPLFSRHRGNRDSLSAAPPEHMPSGKASY